MPLEKGDRVGKRLIGTSGVHLRALTGLELNRPQLRSPVIDDRHPAFECRPIEGRGRVQHFESAHRVSEGRHFRGKFVFKVR